MIRSMFTAISALTLHQNYLDVIANNIANANTIGYKSSRVLFQDQFYQMINPGASPSGSAGGVNPTQIGLGLQLGNISSIFTQGMLQSTGRNMDVAIEGDGFFIYGQGDSRRFSREGALTLDANGFLSNSSTGLRIQGWMNNGTNPIDPSLPPDNIKIDRNRTIAQATSNVVLGGNLDSRIAVNGTTQTTFGVYDSLGNLKTVTMQFTKQSDFTWKWEVTDPKNETETGTFTFDANGQLVAGSTMPKINIPGSTTTNPIDFTVDIKGMTMLSADSDVSSKSQDGLPTGTVSDIYINSNDGAISLVYSNGKREQIGQLALARFTNPEGLVSTGHTSYIQGDNSGDPQIGAAGFGSRGTISTGTLEGSNVDMAQEFTNMILAQRGFQASTKVITTSDEIMQDLVNLKR